MNLTKRGNVWMVDFRNAAGKRLRLSTGKEDKAEAMRVASDIVRSAMAEDVQKGNAHMTLGQALERVYREHWAKLRGERVMRHTVNLITREVGYWPIAEVNYGKLKDYAEGLRRDGLAPATVNRRMSAIGVALRECVRRGELLARCDLPHYTENNKRDRYMTPAEEQACLAWLQREAAAEDVREDADKAAEWRFTHDLVVVLLDTGLRFSEVFMARPLGNEGESPPAHLDLPHGVTKSTVGRTIPLTLRARWAMQRLLANRWWPVVSAMPVATSWPWCSYRWECCTKANACRDVTFHILRHTCASRLVQRGVPIYSVSKWLGHSSVKMTERYAKLAPDTLTQALAALEGKPVAAPFTPDRKVVEVDLAEVEQRVLASLVK